ncbi:hypothetical protein BKA69DRAFT_1173963 [Paraphysoderma sedebokerense]|nr:hypothetical protein BKA69DRAFT_1173963 [Paraphysoderma sedebokerense]
MSVAEIRDSPCHLVEWENFGLDEMKLFSQMIGIELFTLISLLCVQSHELFRISPNLIRNFNVYTFANFAQVALTTILLWTFIHFNVAVTTQCIALSHYMANSYAVTTWFQDFIMLTRIRIFDREIFKKSLFVFIPLLIARAATNLHTAVSIAPIQVTPTVCDTGFPGDKTGRQNIVKAVTYFVETCVLVFLVSRHLQKFDRKDVVARKFLVKTVIICIFSLAVATTFSFFLTLGIEPGHTLMWFGLINTTISISDSFLAQSITEAFLEKNASGSKQAVLSDKLTV